MSTTEEALDAEDELLDANELEELKLDEELAVLLLAEELAPADELELLPTEELAPADELEELTTAASSPPPPHAARVIDISDALTHSDDLLISPPVIKIIATTCRLYVLSRVVADNSQSCCHRR